MVMLYFFIEWPPIVMPPPIPVLWQRGIGVVPQPWMPCVPQWKWRGAAKACECVVIVSLEWSKVQTELICSLRAEVVVDAESNRLGVKNRRRSFGEISSVSTCRARRGITIADKGIHVIAEMMIKAETRRIQFAGRRVRFVERGEPASEF